MHAKLVAASTMDVDTLVDDSEVVAIIPDRNDRLALGVSRLNKEWVLGNGTFVPGTDGNKADGGFWDIGTSSAAADGNFGFTVGGQDVITTATLGEANNNILNRLLGILNSLADYEGNVTDNKLNILAVNSGTAYNVAVVDASTDTGRVGITVSGLSGGSEDVPDTVTGTTVIHSETSLFQGSTRN